MPTKRVQVYRNLNASKKNGVTIYSVRDADTRKVIRHAQSIALVDATFKVIESGRQRVLRTGHKNVHAWVEGTWEQDDAQAQLAARDECERFGASLRYNPHLLGTFHLPSVPEIAWLRARSVLLDGAGIRAVPWLGDPDRCPHPEDSRDTSVAVFPGGVTYTYRKCWKCGQEFHDPQQLREKRLTLRRGTKIVPEPD